MNILHLKGWTISKIKEDERDMLIVAEYDKQATGCPACGCFLLDKHGRSDHLYMDTPAFGKRVGILAQRQRYKCQKCKKTFHQVLPDMDEDHDMTKRLVKHIKSRTFLQTFTSVANDVGVDEKTVRNIFKEHVATPKKCVGK